MPFLTSGRTSARGTYAGEKGGPDHRTRQNARCDFSNTKRIPEKPPCTGLPRMKTLEVTMNIGELRKSV